MNLFFEKEYIGYRFIGKEIAPISDDVEFEAIDDATNTKFKPVNEHISKAVKMLSDRNKPDYENSIKESVTAVETIGKILTGTKGKEATLGNTLKKLEENGTIIHGGLRKAFEALYGYASDAKGIRHTGDIGGPDSTFEEAKFMLVSCCAFINYLIASFAD